MEKSKLLAYLKENLLLLFTLVGVMLGVGLGFAIRPLNPSADAIMWLGLPGQLYLRLLKMMIVPLIVSSVISGTAALDPKVNGKISMVSFLFIFITNTIGAILGVATFLIFRPGAGGSEFEDEAPETQKIETHDIFADLLRNMLPDNLFEATFSQIQTAYRDDEDSAMDVNVTKLVNGSWVNMTERQVAQIRYLKKIGGSNILGLIFACTLLGIAASSLKEKGRLLVQLMEAATHTVIAVMRWFLWFFPIIVLSISLIAVAEISHIGLQVFRALAKFILAVTSAPIFQLCMYFRFVPVGVLSHSLVAVAELSGIGQEFRMLVVFILAVTLYLVQVNFARDSQSQPSCRGEHLGYRFTPLGVLSLSLVAVADISDIGQVFRALAVFILAVTSALIVQQLIVMPLILFTLTRMNPFKLMLNISRPWLIAFAAASTAVTIPEMLHSCEDKLRLDRRVTRFVIPFSVALSANGSAVFIACSCLFISSLTGNAASASSVLVIGLLSAIVSLAIPSAPSASIVTIIMILTSLNIPIDAIALLLAVDFFLDRLRTTSSVVSHCMCAAVTHHICKADLQDPDKYGLDMEMDVVTEARPLNNVDSENVMSMKM